jgi:hypothetical protein
MIDTEVARRKSNGITVSTDPYIEPLMAPTPQGDEFDPEADEKEEKPATISASLVKQSAQKPQFKPQYRPVTMGQQAAMANRSLNYGQLKQIVKEVRARNLALTGPVPDLNESPKMQAAINAALDDLMACIKEKLRPPNDILTEED